MTAILGFFYFSLSGYQEFKSQHSMIKKLYFSESEESDDTSEDPKESFKSKLEKRIDIESPYYIVIFFKYYLFCCCRSKRKSVSDKFDVAVERINREIDI